MINLSGCSVFYLIPMKVGIFCFIFSVFSSPAQNADTLGTSAPSPEKTTAIPPVQIPPNDSDLLKKDFHVGRRKALRDSLPPRSVAAFFSNPSRTRSNDMEYEFHQDPNFHYLTGLDEPNALLLVFKDTQQIDSLFFNEVIFVQPNEPDFELWTGKRHGPDGVKELFGFSVAARNTDFAGFPLDFSGFESILAIFPKEEMTDNKKDRGDLFSLVKHFKEKTDSVPSKTDKRKLAEIMATLREIKLPEEIDLIRKAVSITCDAQVELMKALLPGMTEYQAEAIVEYIFKKSGSEHPGFPSILGGGENTCILHYTANRKTLGWDDLLVSDIGAEYHGYSADVTRTIPVDGEYSPQEAAIYNLVLDAQLAGIKACKKGNKFWDPNLEARKVIQKGLMKLEVIKEPAESSIYFMHGTSHYLGLDVHDAGTFSYLKPGNILTVEPGIYIPAGSACDPKWWNIGVRIEDDVLITTGEPEVLSSCVPKTITEIENLMKQESLFNRINSPEKK